MSVFVDLSADYPQKNALLSQLVKAGISTQIFPRANLKKQEKELFAVMIGIKPVSTCSIDEGCTLDRGCKLGISEFAGLITLVVVEDEIEEALYRPVEKKLDAKGFFCVPRGKEQQAVNFLSATISKIGEFYLRSISENPFEQRSIMREGLKGYILGEWNKTFLSDGGTRARGEETRNIRERI